MSTAETKTKAASAEAAPVGSYRALDSITFSGPDGRATAKPGDVVRVCEEDAKDLLRRKLVEPAT